MLSALRCRSIALFLLVTLSGCGILDPGPTVVIQGHVTAGGEPISGRPVRAVLSGGGCGILGCSDEVGIRGGHAVTDVTGFYKIEGEHDAGCGHGLIVMTSVLGIQVGRVVEGCGEHVVDFSCPPGAPMVVGSIFDQCQ
jgi:hypothetical protein